jgi:hypothetical protein
LQGIAVALDAISNGKFLFKSQVLRTDEM